MSTKQEETQRSDRQAQERGLLETVVGENVMHDLGEPANLRRVQVRQLWEDHYRVNVFVGADAASSTVAHSYFLQADGNGKVVTSTPAIRRLY